MIARAGALLAETGPLQSPGHMLVTANDPAGGKCDSIQRVIDALSSRTIIELAAPPPRCNSFMVRFGKAAAGNARCSGIDSNLHRFIRNETLLLFHRTQAG
jgi:hypothetical protein